MILANSLRLRLLAGGLLWTGLALAIAGVILADLFRQHVHARFVAELTTHLDQLAANLELDPDGRPTVARPLSDPRFARPLSGLYWQVARPDGSLERSRSLWDGAIDLPPDPIASGAVHQHELPGPAEPALLVLERTVVPAGGREPVRLAVGADPRPLDPVMAAFNRTLTLSLAVLGLALLVAALVQVQVGLRPLAGLRRELAAIRKGERKRLSGAVPVEVEPLVEDLNLLLEHNEEVVTRARVQAGNLAHALKTRLAVLAGEARTLRPGNLAEAAASITSQVEHMRRHVDHHMARARAAAARGVPGVGTPLAPSVAALARTLQRLHPEEALEITIDVPGQHRFGGEREDLEEMLGNLMDNACKWARHRVRVTSGSIEGSRLVLRVEDDGPGLPPEQRDAVLAPGVRLDEGTPGAGLGLAVVRDLAQLYGGALKLGCSALGGLSAELELPAARS